MSGVARHAPHDWEGYADKTPADFATWIKTIREDIAASPLPELELPKLDTIFGTDRLASSVGVASSSLRRYVAHLGRASLSYRHHHRHDGRP
jgi:hypothetical protein